MANTLIHKNTREPTRGAKKILAKKDAKEDLHPFQASLEMACRPISSLKLEGLPKKNANRLINYLEKNTKFKTIGDLAKCTDNELRALRYVRGEKTLKIVKAELANLGMGIADGGIEETQDESSGPIKNKRQVLLDKIAKSVRELELSERTINCIVNADINFVYELVLRKKSDLLKSRMFGSYSLREIENKLSGMGLSLGMKLSEWVLTKAREKTGKPIQEKDLDVGSPVRIELDGATATVTNAMVINSNLPKSRLQALIEKALVLEKADKTLACAQGELSALLKFVQPQHVRSIKELLDVLGKPKNA